MKNRLIVGFDGSDASVAALRWAAAEAELRKATVGVVASYEMPSLYAGFGGTMAMVIDIGEIAESLHQQATATARGVFASHPTVDHDVEVVSTGPAFALSRAAEDADLVVVGSTGAGALSRFLLGSVTRSLVGSCPCPVVVVPDEPARNTNRIVVGVDGSDNAMRALEWSVDEADRRQSELVVAHAWKYPYGFAIEGIDLRNDIEQVEAALILERAVQAAREIAGVSVQSELIEGGDVEALLALGAIADLMVVGASGRGRIGSALFGSVARSVATHSTCPAVIVG